ncbi:MAG: cytochrome c4 [Proteobacteria bacterium]|nr:cytochrome c4 [Pseudomonadota bacterium]
MKFLLATLANVAALLLVMAPAFAGDNLIGGDAQAGEAKAAVCAACHGPQGNSVNPEWPKLAGQHAGYAFKQLQVFKLPPDDSPRFNAIMYSQVQQLGEKDMKDLAAYFAAQTQAPGAADPALVEKGGKIYRGGIASKNVPACIACHGPAGEGLAAAQYPKIGGQHATYLVNQLKLYAAGERSSDPNQMMRNLASAMSEDEMQAVASYIQGLQ